MAASEVAGTGKRVSIYNRLLLAVVIGLVFIAGIQLYVLSGETDTYFAWTIAVPLSAAMIGAGYWSALVPAVAALRAAYWEDFWVSLPGALTATTLALVTTLLHLDKFHLSRLELLPRVAAWVWVIVYVVVPPALVAGFLIQRGMPGRAAGRRGDMPGWVRGLLLVQAAAAAATGAALFIVLGAVVPRWGWALTPLTARMIGAWLCAYGVSAAVAVGENDLGRVRGLMAGLAVFGGLQLVALARFAGSVDWGKPVAWLYALFLLSVMVVNGAGMLARRRA
jgi:hypothetical protein